MPSAQTIARPLCVATRPESALTDPWPAWCSVHCTRASAAFYNLGVYESAIASRFGFFAKIRALQLSTFATQSAHRDISRAAEFGRYRGIASALRILSGR